MRNYIFLFILTLLSVQLFSQGSRIKGGVRAGASVSQISGDDLSGFHKLGAYAGVYAYIPITSSEKWKFQMEMNFVMKGSSLFSKGVDNPNINKKYVLNLFYTETPLLIKFNPFKTFEIELGPTINFLFASREVDAGGPIGGRPPFNIFELSILGGISYRFKEHWGVSLRYSNSILPVRVPNWGSTYNRVVNKQFNSTFTLSAVYEF